MDTKQRQIIETLGVKPHIDPSEEIEKRVKFLHDYALSIPGCSGYVLGISGGQDSTLAGKLAQLACDRLKEKRPEARFIAVRLPYVEQFDEEDALLALEFIQPDESYEVNVQKSVDETVNGIEASTGQKVSDFNKGNIKARARMIVQYALAGDRNMLVIGSDHAAEAVTGFFTKYGDGAADVMPLAGLTKKQGRELLEELEADPRLYLKQPTADLLDGAPGELDEDALGISYKDIDTYLTGGKISDVAKHNLETKYDVSTHKREMPLNPKSWSEK